MIARSTFFVLVLLLSWHPAALAKDDSSPCQNAVGTPIRVGAIFPADNLLGASAGNPFRGVQAILEAINTCGGLNGRPVELVYQTANNRDQARDAVAQLPSDVHLVVGSGSPAISEVLSNMASERSFVYWDVTEPLSAVPQPQWAFSPLPGNRLFGTMAADYINTQIPPLLDGQQPRIALINESHAAAQLIANGIRQNLNISPLIEHSYTNDLTDGYRLSVDIREKDINVVVIAAFEEDTDQLWYDLREADANIKAWVQVGGADYRLNTCRRLGNTDGLISISTTGTVNEDYRRSIGAIYDNYLAIYHDKFATTPDESADLSASGMYILLRYVLMPMTGDWTTENIRATITSAEVTPPAGFMGEGLTISPELGENTSAAAIVQQRQNNQFCTIAPSALATCSEPLQPMPTWRERVSQAKYADCG